MDNGLLIGLIALIIFLIMFLISINNETQKKKENDFTNTVNEINNEDKVIALLTELLITEKSNNSKLNIIMWILLIPIIINIAILFFTISVTNGIIEKITSLL